MQYFVNVLYNYSFVQCNTATVPITGPSSNMNKLVLPGIDHVQCSQWKPLIHQDNHKQSHAH